MNTCVIDSVMLSQRGKTLYVIGGFKFRFQKSLVDGTERWSCCKDGCRCFVKVNKKREVTESFTDHNHHKQSELILSRQKLSNLVKQKAVVNPQEQATKLIQKEMMNTNAPMTSYDALLIKNNIYYARASQMQQKILKDYSKNESSKTKKAKNGLAGENSGKHTFIKEQSFLQPACEEMQASSDEGESTDTVEENNVATSQNSFPAPAKIKNSMIDQHMLLQPLHESVPNSAEVHNKGDPDMHFLLSLLPHFKSIPEHLKFEAHFDIMRVIKKYKTAGHAQSSYLLNQSIGTYSLQLSNPSSHTESSDHLQTSMCCKVESVDSFAEEFSSEVVGYEDVKFRRPDV